MKQEIFLSGQFRVVKKDASGNVLFDSGMVKNLILDTGLDFFGGNGGNIMSCLALGSGNSKPINSQNKLDNLVAVSGRREHEKKFDYNEARDGEYYTVGRTCRYRFDNLNNVNISELGLIDKSSISVASRGYIAYTRALIKDGQGRPTTITVLSGEILDVYYTINQVFYLRDVVGVVNLSDGRGGSRGTINYIMRLARVGVGNYANYVGDIFKDAVTYSHHRVFENQTLGTVQATPSGASKSITSGFSHTLDAYITGSYKRKLTINLSVNDDYPVIGSMVLITTMGFYQVSLAREDGGTIGKTTEQTFSITLEVSWARDARGA